MWWLLPATCLAAPPPLVETSVGSFRGVRTASGGANFFGIPFAEPPVGALRWKKPQPVIHDGSPRDARTMGHNCFQNPSSSMMGWPQPLSTQSEDCLYLNVYTGPKSNASGVPVLFWIYGGGFQGGGGNETRLNGTWDVALMRGELIVVTSNYRLNVFGFAASRDLQTREGGGASTGNYGLLDQRAAMKWVHEHIAHFGGDPSRVLLVGQSAGASSVSQHLVRPASWPYFSAAGMESGAFYDGLDTPTTAELRPQWQKLAAYLECGGASDPTSCMASADPIALLNSTLAGGIRAAWNPTIDGVELSAPGPVLASNGTLAPVPIFAGYVLEDINALGNPQCAGGKSSACTRDDFVALLAANDVAAVDRDRVADLYATEGPRPGSDASGWYWAAKHAGAEAWAGCPARRVARWAASRGQRSYWYRWSYVPDGPNGKNLAHHACEQPFVFHVLAESAGETRVDGGVYHINATREASFSASVVRAWHAMASRGDPNVDGDVPWPLFNRSAHGSARLFDGGAGEPPSIGASDDLIAERCKYWDSWFWENPVRQRGQAPRRRAIDFREGVYE